MRKQCILNESPFGANFGLVKWLGPYLFEDDVSNVVRVNGERYRDMITEFLWPVLDGMDLDEMWIQ